MVCVIEVNFGKLVVMICYPKNMKYIINFYKVKSKSKIRLVNAYEL